MLHVICDIRVLYVMCAAYESALCVCCVTGICGAVYDVCYLLRVSIYAWYVSVLCALCLICVKYVYLLYVACGMCAAYVVCVSGLWCLWCVCRGGGWISRD